MTELTANSKPHEVRKAWANELETTFMIQGHGHLAPGHFTRCCLGILCDLAVEAGVIDNYNGYAPHLPDEVRNWAGLYNHAGRLTKSVLLENRGIHATNLALLNDSGHFTFKKIAKLIRGNRVRVINQRKSRRKTN